MFTGPGRPVVIVSNAWRNASGNMSTRVGWKLRRLVSPLQPLAWMAGGTPPSRIGYGPGPLQALRDWRQRGLRRTLRVCLLEQHRRGARFAAAHAYWLNRRSRVCTAVVNQPDGADVVWVFSQDPLAPDVRRRLEDTLAALPPEVVVLNPLPAYDAYHDDRSFDRLRAAGVGVPATTFGPDDEGRTPVVHKAAGQQSCHKFLAPWDGPRPGYRAFGYVDGRGGDGRARRYRAYHLLGEVYADDVLIADDWKVSLSTMRDVEHAFVATPHEHAQIRRIGDVLGLDVFCVDFLRRAGDGAPVFTDINVYPTIVIAESVDRALRARGRWHVFDTRRRHGLPEPEGRSAWERLDDALLLRVAHARLRVAA